MQKLKLNGNKTYLAAIAGILTLIIGPDPKALDATMLYQNIIYNMPEILAMLGLMALRSGVKKSEKKDAT